MRYQPAVLTASSTLINLVSHQTLVRQGAIPNILKLQHGKDPGQNSGIKSKLKRLSLFDNEIHTIEDNAFMAESLERLRLRMNKIKDIANRFKHLSGKSP